MMSKFPEYFEDDFLLNIRLNPMISVFDLNLIFELSRPSIENTFIKSIEIESPETARLDIYHEIMPSQLSPTLEELSNLQSGASSPYYLSHSTTKDKNEREKNVDQQSTSESGVGETPSCDDIDYALKSLSFATPPRVRQSHSQNSTQNSTSPYNDSTEPESLDDIVSDTKYYSNRSSYRELKSLQPLQIQLKVRNPKDFNQIPCLKSETPTARKDNNRNAINLKNIDNGTMEWLQEMSYQGIIICGEDRRQSIINTLIQDSATLDINLRSRICHKNRVLQGGTLIITAKELIESWASIVRSEPTLSLHIYTESLSKRQQNGAQHLVSYDFVISTVEILKAKEVLISEDAEGIWMNERMNSKENDRNNIQESDFFARPWLSPRGKGYENTQRSNLHILRWNRVILDHTNDKVRMRLGNVRGDAIRNLEASSKFALCTTRAHEDFLSDNRFLKREDGQQICPSIILNIRDVLGFPSDVDSDSYIFRVLD